MDVNGTRFHLIHGQRDWQRCTEEAQPTDWLKAAWDADSASVTLSPLLSLFPRGRRDVPLEPEARRGSAVDRFGNWYWISHDRQRLYWQPYQSGKASVWWEQTAAACPPATGDFAPTMPAEPIIAKLAGLAVTSHHYLVVGDTSNGGLFVFDLHAGGEPLHLLFPAEVPFAPFDMAAAPGGGVWILDTIHRAYWGLDRTFNLVTEAAFLQEIEPEQTADFRPVGGTAVVRPGRSFPQGFPLTGTADPISIEALPDGTVLILDNPALPDTLSTLFHYYLGSQMSPPLPLADEVEVTDVGGEITRHHLAVIGHDMAYTSHDQTLYVVERDGNQAIAFRLELLASPPQLTVRRDYLPMHFYGGRAIVAGPETGDGVYYDVVGRDPTRDTAVRWVKLQPIERPRYAREATLLSPVLDGKERHCVWHRLFLDACLPPETAVLISTRAHDDLDLLASVPFSSEPALYLRGAGTEIPYYQPFTDDESESVGNGTWELLFQQAHGRYLQIRLELQGNSHATPQLLALRAYYPRFSYPQHYLPAVYYEDDGPGSFVERLLANMEGFYSEIEGKMAVADALFDGRSAPPEALDWLSGWLGLMLDPLWAQIQARRQVATNGQTTAPDRRRLFIRYARLLYERHGTLDGIRFALHLLLDPCLEVLLDRFKLAAINPNTTLSAQLARFDLPTPTPATPETEIEDLLYSYVLRRPSQIRLVERFQTRGGLALVVGDPTQNEASTTLNSTAHRFSVLVPEGLLPEEEAMIGRIVNLEKPAHTEYEVRRYWAGFRIGEARLGLDTTLDESHRYRPHILGQGYLSETYLERAQPMNVPDRFISDRDRLGQLPPL